MDDRPDLPRPTELALRPGYHSPQLEVAVRLNTNEAPEPPPAGFMADLAEELSRLELNRYPDRAAGRLRRALAEHHGVGPEEIFCANGSNEVLQCLNLAYAGPGRSVLVFEPTYALHAHISRLTGGQVLEGARDDRFLVDVEGALALLARVAGERGPGEPALTMLCSPNNPTGRSEPPATIEALAGAAPGLLVVDEAYGQFAAFSALQLLGTHRRAVVVRTFSKTWALAGARLGYLVADREIVAACEQVALPYHLDAIKQAAGRLALRYGAEMRARIAGLVEERGRVTAGLSDMGVTVWPSDANFILFRVPGHEGPAVWRELVEASVLVRDVSGWPALAGCLRVTLGTPDENARFLAAMSTITSPAGSPGTR
ncbi:MAG TPA: aminotransferase class I/II-fold pyridoxal phosphate-dependent enzyme [Acidimicrobiales bacterium]|jgi:histidinol-phosphate aminotransferase|nr:aminotransferase class I/II-fold pyridoxal phosphate-dependent enzyme [Acidimicrobiales bacterium]